uniref:ESAT-6-like protein n=1 Tax=Caenorhabditis tropicalis TaxID=1561998 RepID=A0A1I7U774_9PELO
MYNSSLHSKRSIHFQPNTELLAAIKDVVAKFKASLDEAGIDQDVRLMGNQLKNTWQQLRTGPMNEQIGRLFEKAVADAADQKTQQQIQQVHQQMIASRP